MNNIGIKLTVNSDQTKSGLKQVSSSLTTVGRNAKATSDKFGGLNNKLKQSNMMFANISKDANRSAQSLSKLTGSLGGLNQVLGATAMYALSRGIASVVQSSIDAIEVTNLFSVSLGMLAEETDVVVQGLSEVYGLDSTNLRSSVGTFSLLARSMGMTGENAQTLGINTAQLAIDLSSLTNVPINQVMGDLRSGLVGQSETMYKYGVDVTEASLKQEALNRGISKSVRNMSQGEKMGLRYAVMLRQTQLAQGDFAKTINSPANQLKILYERMVTLSRSIGSLFVPALSMILPYANAVATALINVVNAMALMFGYEPPVVKNIANGFSGVEDGANNASDAIDGVGKSMKNLTSGMDELNVLDATSGGKGSGDGATVGGGEFDLEGYDNKSSLIVDRTQEMIGNMTSLFNAFKPLGTLAFDNLIYFYTNFIEPISKTIMNESVPNFMGFLERVLGVLGETMKKIQPSVRTFIDKILTPLATFVVTDLLNAFLGTLESTIKLLATAIEILTPWATELFEKLLLPLALWTGGLVVEILGDLQVKLDGLTAWIKSNPEWFLGFVELVSALALAFGAVTTAIKLWGVASAISASSTTALAGAFAFLTSATGIWGLAIAGVIIVIWALVKNWDDVVVALRKAWYYGILPLYGAIVANLTNVFIALGNAVGFIVMGISNGFKTMYNNVAKQFNNIVDLYNKVARELKLNPITFSIKYAVLDTFKPDKFKDIKDIIGDVDGQKLETGTQKFARGGLLEDGQLFRAGEFGKSEMIGNYNGKSAVMPLENTGFVEAIYEAVFSAMTASSGSNETVINNVLTLDGDTIYKNQQKVANTRGVNLNMGVFAR